MCILVLAIVLSTYLFPYGAVDMPLLVLCHLLVRRERNIRCRWTFLLFRTVFCSFLLGDPLFVFVAFSPTLAMLVQNVMLCMVFVVCTSTTHIVVIVVVAELTHRCPFVGLHGHSRLAGSPRVPFNLWPWRRFAANVVALLRSLIQLLLELMSAPFLHTSWSVWLCTTGPCAIRKVWACWIVHQLTHFRLSHAVPHVFVHFSQSLHFFAVCGAFFGIAFAFGVTVFVFVFWLDLSA